MFRLAAVLIGLIAALHFYIAWFEMFAWVERGPKVFSTMPRHLFEPTRAMAANQGLYNGFLGVGLTWSLFIADRHWRTNVALCFLLFVAVAGIFGALTVSVKILLIQTVPSVITITLLLINRQRETLGAVTD